MSVLKIKIMKNKVLTRNYLINVIVKCLEMRNTYREQWKQIVDGRLQARF